MKLTGHSEGGVRPRPRSRGPTEVDRNGENSVKEARATRTPGSTSLDGSRGVSIQARVQATALAHRHCGPSLLFCHL